jgi:hypothetical protein
MQILLSMIVLLSLTMCNAFAMGDSYQEEKTHDGMVNNVAKAKPSGASDVDAGNKKLDDGTSRIEKADRFEEDKVDREHNVMPRTNPADLVTGGHP